MNILKRHCLTALLLLTAALPALAQSGQYGNEWIDYNKTYYKFKVAADGIYRISRASLDAMGLPASVTGANFLLFRDGKEVPVWVSANQMSPADYIEFAGRGADGVLDSELYATANARQADEHLSLFTDTACYYLTYDNGSGHLRFAQSPNNIPSIPPAPESWCWSTTGSYFRNAFMPGKSNKDDDAFYASLFENGEGYVNAVSGIGAPMSLFLPTPNAVTNAPAGASLRTSVLTLSYGNSTSIPPIPQGNQHEVKVLLNNQVVADSSFGISEAKRYSLSVPASLLTSNNEIKYSPVQQGPAYDLYGVSFVELEYPRNYNVSGISYFPFRLNAAPGSQYLEFLNFGPGRLYDVTNRTWYTGDVSVSGKTRFYLQPSLTDRQLILYADAVAASLSPVKKIQFTDYSQPASQGDYIILTHSALDPSGGYVQQYQAYRNSIAGGQHKAIVVHVDDLYDAFGYGYDIHPQSIRHFLKYAYDTWQQKPDYVNIIGHGVFYNKYGQYKASPSTYNFPIVPTYGNPGSDVDFVNFGTNWRQKIKLGRVSVWNTGEIGTYLDKVKAFEQALQPAPLPTLSTELWKKKMLHVVGTGFQSIQQGLLLAMNEGKRIIEDSLTGKKVYTISKASTAYQDLINSQFVDSMINTGVSMISFYGHANPQGFDFTFKNPEDYHGGPRLPLFLAMGCDIAQIYDLSTSRTISERYILTPNGGSVAMWASVNAGYTDFYPTYIVDVYSSMATRNYGGSIGRHFQAAYDSIVAFYTSGTTIVSPYVYTNVESQLLLGDPALHVYSAPKPDYYVNDEGLTAIPGNVTTSMDSFQLRITSFNLGKAIGDTVWVKIEHTNPSAATTTVRTIPVVNLFYTDTSLVWIPIDKTKDLGLNKYRVTIDSRNEYDEISESNNVATLDLFIYSNNLIPVYPPEFAIVNQPNVTLKASTINPFRPVAQYRLEIDTTALFNSPQKLQTTVVSPGGVIKWTPAGLMMRDSTVYYWRAAFDSTYNGSYQWTQSSFIYLPQSSPGWNQSHYYQYTRDTYDSLNLGSDRIFRFPMVNNQWWVRNMIPRNGAQYNTDGDLMRTVWNAVVIQRLPQLHSNSLQVMVIDSISGKFWLNSSTNSAGALPPASITAPVGYYVHEFNVASTAGRMAASRYIDSIPNGNYVMLKNILYEVELPYNLYIDTWRADSATNNGKSLYHSIRDLGFSKIDSYTHARAFLFVRRKGDAGYPVYQGVTNALGDMLDTTLTVPGAATARGRMNSTVIGPAKAWTSLKWKHHSNDPLPDTATVNVYGIDAAKTETLLYSGRAKDTTLSFIDAKQYPNIRLLWTVVDSAAYTSAQMDYWRVLYSPVPEAALNPAIHYAFSDSLEGGQPEHFSVTIENLTGLPMDSMLVRYRVIDAGGVTHPLADKRYRKLPGNDTLNADFTFDPRPYPGKNYFYVEANPDNDQPEQYHPNNIGYLPFRISVDQRNPLLDVTFDGVHILDHDIVSSKPFIKVTLKDENKYLSLDDTGLVSVSMRYPNDPISSSRPIPFDGSTCRFIPATTGSGKNEAVVELRPDLTEDGTYTLYVTGKDRSGNGAGQPQGSNAQPKYQVEFVVENKPSVTHVLNYPNPFSTSTAFLFTLTGSQVPSQFKIQVLSVSGKVVREITKEELGPIHIGRNITDYKWDGRDQYGQMLGNGVYMYRVVTSLNGNAIEHRDSGADKFFKNGYGKMVIMR